MQIRTLGELWRQLLLLRLCHVFGIICVGKAFSG